MGDRSSRLRVEAIIRRFRHATAMAELVVDEETREAAAYLLMAVEAHLAELRRAARSLKR